MFNLCSIKIKGVEIPVKINSNRNFKNFKLSFNIDKGYMNISKPFFMNISSVNKYIKVNEDLIYTEYLKMLEYKKEFDIKKEKIKRKWVTGEKLLYLGEEYTLVINEVDKNLVNLSFEKDSKIIITIKSDLDEDERQYNIIKIVKKMLKEKTEEIICERLKYWTKITGISYNSVRVKYVKTRWGSCVKSTKSLNFSSRLAMFQLDVIDAVIVHELCHIVYPNHSSKYWNLVYKFVPKYRECDVWIKRNMSKFMLD